MWRWFIPLLGALALSLSCGGGGNDEADIRRTVDAFVRTFNENELAEAYTYLSEECRSQLSLDEFMGSIALARGLLGEDIEFKLKQVDVLEVDDDSARVDTTVVLLSGGEELDLNKGDRGPERIVKEDGRWRFADCEGFARGGGSSDFGDVTVEPLATGEAEVTSTPAGPGTARGDAVAFGETLVAPSGVEVTVLDVNADAWAAVQAENEFNGPPEAGKRMVLVHVHVAYRAPADHEPASEETVEISEGDFKLTGSKNVVYTTYDVSCGLIPEPLQAELFEGGSAEGNVCFQVPVEETGLILIFEPFFGFGEAGRRYLALK